MTPLAPEPRSEVDHAHQRCFIWPRRGSGYSWSELEMYIQQIWQQHWVISCMYGRVVTVISTLWHHLLLNHDPKRIISTKRLHIISIFNMILIHTHKSGDAFMSHDSVHDIILQISDNLVRILFRKLNMNSD